MWSGPTMRQASIKSCSAGFTKPAGSATTTTARPRPPANHPPVANAGHGRRQLIAWDTACASVTLNGFGIHRSGMEDALSYVWTDQANNAVGRDDGCGAAQRHNWVFHWFYPHGDGHRRPCLSTARDERHGAGYGASDVERGAGLRTTCGRRIINWFRSRLAWATERRLRCPPQGATGWSITSSERNDSIDIQAVGGRTSGLRNGCAFISY